MGNSAGVGIGSTISYTNRVVGGGRTDKFVATQNIYLPNHGFVDGQKLTYNNGDGTSLQVYNGIYTFTLANNSPVFAMNQSRDLLGISTNALGIGTGGDVTGIGSTA